ncbi:MAG: hypothetical protein K2Y23_22935 [Cyanobacteria bacterium]|nr:hypothetical protein [Cyanobacteriota bacterium]
MTAMTLANGLLLLTLGHAAIMQSAAGPPADATAVQAFERAIAQYMSLREQLIGETGGLKPDSTSAQLTQASDALAAAVQRARRGAKQGAIFASPVSDVFRRRIGEAIKRDDLAGVLSSIDDETPAKTTPAVHLRFPAASQMATMPPSLLAVLPKLPAALEYRIIGDVLILRDVEAALILDFIPAAVPR